MLLGQPLPVVVAAAAIVAVSSTLQATVGFGLALLAIPLLHLIGFEPPAAIAISSSAMLVQMANGVLRLRASVRARELLWPLVITMATMVLGVLALRAVVAVKPDLARQATGVVVLGALVVLQVVRPAPRPRVAAPWTVLAMSASGLLSGSTGMGGPPLALWSYAHEWPAERIRATIWAIALPATAVLLVLLAVTFGPSAIRALALAALLAPFALAGSNAGLALARRLSVERLRTAAFVVLAVLGVSAIVRPLL